MHLRGLGKNRFRQWRITPRDHAAVNAVRGWPHRHASGMPAGETQMCAGKRTLCRTRSHRTELPVPAGELRDGRQFLVVMRPRQVHFAQHATCQRWSRMHLTVARIPVGRVFAVGVVAGIMRGAGLSTLRLLPEAFSGLEARGKPDHLGGRTAEPRPVGCLAKPCGSLPREGDGNPAGRARPGAGCTVGPREAAPIDGISVPRASSEHAASRGEEEGCPWECPGTRSCRHRAMVAMRDRALCGTVPNRPGRRSASATCEDATSQRPAIGCRFDSFERRRSGNFQKVPLAPTGGVPGVSGRIPGREAPYPGSGGKEPPHRPATQFEFRHFPSSRRQASSRSAIPSPRRSRDR